MASITSLRSEAGHPHDHAAIDLPFLGEAERRVLAARLGLDGAGPRTLTDAARVVHMGRDRVVRVESVVACKLRHPSASAWEPDVSRLLAAIESLP